ncbi:hypothetical protein HGRIS_013241 [Hohenbuehelia grisea]|uniref:RlpA-like protein double-psi beta-barrel domain-containing protein n=1 Tax=Hohenbuehelia grisea TaxID=104357 RepID=A0ABR3IV11_9AGAR
MLFQSFNVLFAAASAWRASAAPIPIKATSVQSQPEVLSGSFNLTERSLEKRFSGGRFTFYDAGLGACGKTNSDSDFIVAVNPVQYEGGKRCFETITITARGKTHSAQIVDLCPGCPSGGLDFSRSLFKFFASEDEGVISGDWSFGGSSGGGGSGGDPKPKANNADAEPKPKTTSTTAKPTSTTQKAAPTPEAAPSPSSTKTSSRTSTTSSSSTSSSQPSSTPTSSGSDDPTPEDFLAELNRAFISLSSLALAAVKTDEAS